jgi:hypothetical protein
MCDSPWNRGVPPLCERWTLVTTPSLANSSFDVLQIVHSSISALLLVSSIIALWRTHRAMAKAKARTAPAPNSHAAAAAVNAHQRAPANTTIANTNQTISGIDGPSNMGHVRTLSNGMRLPSARRRTFQLLMLIIASSCECIRAADPFGARSWIPTVITLLAIDIGMACIFGIIASVLLSWLDLTGPRSTSQLYTISSEAVPSPSARRPPAAAVSWVNNNNHNEAITDGRSPMSGDRSMSMTPSRDRRHMRSFVTSSMIVMMLVYIVGAIGQVGNIIGGPSYMWESITYLITSIPLVILLVLLLRATQRYHLLPQGMISPAGGTSIRPVASKQSVSSSKLSARDEARSRPTTAEQNNGNGVNQNGNGIIINNTTLPHAPILAGDCCSAMRPLLLALHLTVGIALQITLALIALQRGTPLAAPSDVVSLISLMPCDIFILLSCILMMTPLPYLRVISLSNHGTIAVAAEVVIDKPTPLIATRGHKDSMTSAASGSPPIHGYHKVDSTGMMHGGSIISVPSYANDINNGHGNGGTFGGTTAASNGGGEGKTRMETTPPATGRSPRLTGMKGDVTMSPRLLSHSHVFGTSPRPSTLLIPRPINPQLGLIDDPADMETNNNNNNIVYTLPRRSLTTAPSVPHTTSGTLSGGNSARGSRHSSPTEVDAHAHNNHGGHGMDANNNNNKSLFAPPGHGHKGSFGMERTAGGWSPIQQRTDSSFVGGSLRVSLTESTEFDLKASSLIMSSTSMSGSSGSSAIVARALPNANNNGASSSREGTPRRAPSSHGMKHTRSESVTLAQPFTSTPSAAGLGLGNGNASNSNTNSIAGSGPQVVRRGSSSRLVTAHSSPSPAHGATHAPNATTTTEVRRFSWHHSIVDAAPLPNDSSSSSMTTTSMTSVISTSTTMIAPHQHHQLQQHHSVAASHNHSHAHHLLTSESSPPVPSRAPSMNATTLSIRLPSPTHASSASISPITYVNGVPPLNNDVIPYHILTQSAPPSLLRVGSNTNTPSSISLSPLRANTPGASGQPNMARRPSVTVRSPIQQHAPPMSLIRPTAPNDLISPGGSGFHLSLPSPIPSPPQTGSARNHPFPISGSLSPVSGGVSPSSSSMGQSMGPPSPTPMGPSFVPPVVLPSAAGGGDRVNVETNKMMKLFPGLSPQWAGLLSAMKLERGGTPLASPHSGTLNSNTSVATTTTTAAATAATAGLTPFGPRGSRATMIRPLSQAETSRLLAHKGITNTTNTNGSSSAPSTATGEGRGMLAHLKRMIQTTPEKDYLRHQRQRHHRRCYSAVYHFPVRRRNRRQSFPSCNVDDQRIISHTATLKGNNNNNTDNLSPSQSLLSSMDIKRGTINVAGGSATQRGVSFRDHAPLSPMDNGNSNTDEKKSLLRSKFALKRPNGINTNNNTANTGHGDIASGSGSGVAPLSLANLSVPHTPGGTMTGSVSDRPHSAGGGMRRAPLSSSTPLSAAGSPGGGGADRSARTEREPKSARGTIGTPSMDTPSRLSIAANSKDAAAAASNKGFWNRVKNKLAAKPSTPDSPSLTPMNGNGGHSRLASTSTPISNGGNSGGHSRRQSSLGDIRAFCKQSGFDESVDLEKLISDPIGLDFFTRYLRTEYSEENIEFWLHVNDFVKLTDPGNTQHPRLSYTCFIH